MHPASTSQVHSRPDHGSHLSTQRSAYFLRSEKQLRSRKNEHSEWTGGTPLADSSRLSNRAHFPHVPCKGSGSPANTSQALSAAQQPLDYPSRKLVTSCTHPADTANACASTHPLVFPGGVRPLHSLPWRAPALHKCTACFITSCTSMPRWLGSPWNCGPRYMQAQCIHAASIAEKIGCEILISFHLFNLKGPKAYIEVGSFIAR